MKYCYITLLILSFNAIQASIYSRLKENIQSFLQQKTNQVKDENDFQITEPKVMRHSSHHKSQDDIKDKKSAQSKASIIKKVRTHEKNLNIGQDMSSKLTGSHNENNKPIGREYFRMDPVLNQLKRRSPTFRRYIGSDEGGGESSSLEMRFWMDEWNEHWMQKKFEAVNSTQHRGDVVNMVAARPWGVPCGDPNQHDMPWGSCMLAAECDAEYRIYRGDFFCGRTAFICCSLQLTNYDLYQGIDISFDDSSFATDSNEKHGQKGSKEGDRKKRMREKNKRKRERDKRKKKIKASIRQIEIEIKKILSRAYRNGTNQRKKKTKELKKFIEMMKKKFKKDRKSVVNIHEYEMVKLDESLQKKLNQISNVNEQFMSNNTFRDIVVNGTINKQKVLMLLRTFPELRKLFKGGRRTDINIMDINEEENKALKLPEKKKNPKILEYDIEYGQLYY